MSPVCGRQSPIQKSKEGQPTHPQDAIPAAQLQIGQIEIVCSRPVAKRCSFDGSSGVNIVSVVGCTMQSSSHAAAYFGILHLLRLLGIVY